MVTADVAHRERGEAGEVDRDSGEPAEHDRGDNGGAGGADAEGGEDDDGEEGAGRNTPPMRLGEFEEVGVVVLPTKPARRVAGHPQEAGVDLCPEAELRRVYQ